MPTKHQSTLAHLRELLAKTGLPPQRFIIPALLGLAAALFEGFSIFLLLPVIQASIKLNFVFLKDFPLVKVTNSKFPGFLPTEEIPLFLAFVTLVLIAAMLKIFFSYAATIGCADLARRFSNRLRQSLFERCLRFGKLYFDSANAGHLQYLVLSPAESIVAQMLAFQDIVTWFFMLIIYIILMFRISVKLTLGILVVFPLMHLLLRFLSARIKAASRQQAEERKHISGYLAGALANMLLIKASASEEYEMKRFREASLQLERFEFNLDKSVALVRPLQEVIFLITLVLALLALAFVAGNQRSGLIPGLLVYVYLLRRTSLAVNVAGRLNACLAAIHGPIIDVLHLFEDADKSRILEGTVEYTGLRRGIEVSHLSYEFKNGVKTLHDISFLIRKGETTAIVGPSGTGKTTLINLILRFYDPPPGTIFLDGTDIRTLASASFLRHVALITQDTLFFNDTIRHNIAYPFNGGVPEEALWSALSQAKLDVFIKKLPQGLDTPIGDRGVKLSGGEKQRLSIARAILKNADLLVLDEATSALDSQTEMLIQQSIEAVLKGRTAIVIAHRLSTIKNAGNIIVMEYGKIVEQGPKQELLSRRGYFHAYWDAQRFD